MRESRGVLAPLLLALALFGTGCEDDIVAQCTCATDDACQADEFCNGCHCQGLCQSAADCSPATPNCNSDTGRCFGPCTDGADCIDPGNPVCDPDIGLCQGVCPEAACPVSLPLCPSSGLCLPPCATSADCPDASEPNCNPADGTCFGPCATSADCFVADQPNCDPVTGVCFGKCTAAADCTVAAFPVCDPDPASGVCQGACPGTTCPATLPNCEPTGGTCEPPCATNADCPDAGTPNCAADGTCFAPCTAHADCTNSSFPNCDQDPGSATSGQCLGPCRDNVDCPSALFPNCDFPGGGLCIPPCNNDPDCPTGLVCDTGTNLCISPPCSVDSDCTPPITVCESNFCVFGCTQHSDCRPADRCDLITNVNHCEPRDCVADGDCNPPTEVCDTDGLALPAAGGFCLPGCATPYDCPIGFDCDAATGACAAHDYGDVGQPCPGGACAGCASGQGIDDGGTMVCTAFCCDQHACPAGMACRAVSDGESAAPCAASNCRLDECAPIEAANDQRQVGEACSRSDQCRSNVCFSGRCRNTCCIDAQCTGAGEHCGNIGNGVTACVAGNPATDLGALGCATPPGAATLSCNAQMCFSRFLPDDGCTDTSTCPALYDNFCGDFDGEADANECVYDFCVSHCCTTADCAGSVTGEAFFCAKRLFGGAGDVNVCLLLSSQGAALEGAACAANGDCASNFCGSTSPVCRERCCTDADCATAAAPRCGAEEHTVYGQLRVVLVCVP